MRPTARPLTRCLEETERLGGGDGDGRGCHSERTVREGVGCHSLPLKLAPLAAQISRSHTANGPSLLTAHSRTLAFLRLFCFHRGGAPNADLLIWKRARKASSEWPCSRCAGSTGVEADAGDAATGGSTEDEQAAESGGEQLECQQSPPGGPHIIQKVASRRVRRLEAKANPRLPRKACRGKRRAKANSASVPQALAGPCEHRRRAASAARGRGDCAMEWPRCFTRPRRVGCAQCHYRGGRQRTHMKCT